MKYRKIRRKGQVLATMVFVVWAAAGISGRAQEITEFKGEKLTPLKEQANTYIGKPPKVDLSKYRLQVTGKVNKPLELSYDEILALPREARVIDLNCVEGWGFKALWTGVKVVDLAALAEADPKAKTVIFHEIGGTYSSALPLEYLREMNVLLAFQVNGLAIPPERGFPFQVTAEGKWGYKWVKWVEKIEFSDKDYQGYWEKRGYPNSADIKKKQLTCSLQKRPHESAESRKAKGGSVSLEF